MTPSQLAFHEAHKARQARFVAAAERYEWNKKAAQDRLAAPKADVISLERQRQRRDYETTRRKMQYQTMAQRVIGAVAREFDLTPADITGPVRRQHLCVARFVAIGLLMEMTNMSLPAVGRRFGGRDHTSILHARKKAQQLFADESFRNRLDQIRASIA